MRRGKNPFKKKTPIEPPARITVGVLNCIPNQEGYFGGQLDSLKLCLASLRQHAEEPFELMVVDNASCPEVRRWLEQAQAEGTIDYLVLNRRNIGRPNGVRQVLRSAPGDLVMYSDGDIFYRPGWLTSHLEVLESFPDVGMVGGLPIRHLVDYYTDATRTWAAENHQDVREEVGALIPDQAILEYFASLGYADTQARLDAVRDTEDRRLTYRGVSAFVGASHMQFVMPRAVIERLPHRRFDQATGLNPEIMDAMIDEEGLLRLATAEPTVYHIGNRITEPWLEAHFAEWIGQRRQSPSAPRGNWLTRRWRVHQLIGKIHEWSFRHYYG